MHNGLVVAGGEKMSKSIGNILDLAELLADTDARAYRLLVLRSHYRSPLEVTPATIEDASRQLERVDALGRRLGELDAPSGAGGAEAEAEFRAAMDDDLDTPLALAGLFESIRRANALLDEGDAPGGAALGRKALELLAALGLEAAGEEQAPPEVLALAAARDEARARGDFAAADGLRARLGELGWLAEDTAAGTRLRRGTSGR